MRWYLALLAALALAGTAQASPYDACFASAAAHYRVPAKVLKAIAHVESRGNPAAFNRNKNGSADYGVMQINSGNLREFAKYGIGHEHLADPCWNIHLGAYVLAQKVRKYGWNWTAIGAYNAGDPGKRAIYARKIAQQLAADL